MGKILLAVILVAGGWGIWSVYSKWTDRTSTKKAGRESKVAQSVPSPTPALVAQEEEPTEEAQEEVLLVAGSCREWLYVQEWGVVSIGDLLPDGSKLQSWYAVGSDWFAKVVCGARSRIIRFARPAELLALNLEKYPLPPVAMSVPGLVPPGTNSVAAPGVGQP